MKIKIFSSRVFQTSRLIKNVATFFTAAVLATSGSGFLTGCASASVRSMYQSGSSFSSPNTVYVQPYSFNESRLAVDRTGAKLQDFQRELSGQMAQKLQKDLSKIFPKQRVVVSTEPPKGPYWLVKGSFDHIEQGSRALRGFIGCGLGKTRLDATTQIYSLASRTPRLLYTVETTASSAGMPGILPSLVFFPFAPSAIMGVWQGGTSGLSFDVQRTSHETTAAITHYLHQNGDLPKHKVLRVKYAGR